MGRTSVEIKMFHKRANNSLNYVGLQRHIFSRIEITRPFFLFWNSFEAHKVLFFIELYLGLVVDKTMLELKKIIFEDNKRKGVFGIGRQYTVLPPRVLWRKKRHLR